MIADGANDPDWIAADLLSQAEHDASSQSILITDDAAFADKVAEAAAARAGASAAQGHRVAEAGPTMAASSWWRSWTMPPALADRFAPEHLEIATADPERLAGQGAPCRRDLPGPPHAGSDGRLHRRSQPCAADLAHGAFLVGPFGAGFHEAHHVAVAGCQARSPRSGPHAITLAEAEGLEAHARSIAARLNREALTWTTGISAIALDEKSVVQPHAARSSRNAKSRSTTFWKPMLQAQRLARRALPPGPEREGKPAGVRHHAAKSGTRHGPDHAVADAVPQIIKDYFLVCDSYYKAIRTAPPSPDRVPGYGPPRLARRRHRALASSA